MPDATIGSKTLKTRSPQPLLEQRKKARDHQLFMRFLALSPRAEAYYLKLEERRLIRTSRTQNRGLEALP